MSVRRTVSTPFSILLLLVALAWAALPSAAHAADFDEAVERLTLEVAEALSIRSLGRDAAADLYVRPPFDDVSRVVCPPLSRRLARALRADLPRAFDVKKLPRARLVQDQNTGPGNFMLIVTWRAMHDDETLEISFELGDLETAQVATMGGYSVHVQMSDLRESERQCLAKIDVINKVVVAETTLFVHRAADVFSKELAMIEPGQRFRLLGRMPYTDGDWAVVKPLEGAVNDPFNEVVGFATLPPTQDERDARAERERIAEEKRKREAEAAERRAKEEAERIRREEEARRAEEEAREKARRQAEDEARQAEEQLRRLETERRRLAEEAARAKAERERLEKESQRADEERRRLRELEERQRLAKEAERANEARKQREDEAKRLAAEQEQRRLAEEQAQRDFASRQRQQPPARSGTGVVGQWQCQGRESVNAASYVQGAFQIQFQPDGSYSFGAQLTTFVNNQWAGQAIVGEYGVYRMSGTRLDMTPQGGLPMRQFTPYSMQVTAHSGQSFTMNSTTSNGQYRCQRVF
ncbi:MAG: hypothetical protein ACFBRM_09835 [Pikeienuella sp.]